MKIGLPEAGFFAKVMLSGTPYFGEVCSLLAAATWGLAVILFKKSGETVHPIALNLFKNSLGAVLFLPTLYLFGETLAYAAPPGDYLLLLASGALGIGIADSLFFKSLNLLGASLTAIVDCLYTPFVIGLSMLWLDEALTLWQVIGAVMIISAIVTATGKKGRDHLTPRALYLGILLGALSLAAMAVGIVMIKPVLNRSPLLWATEMRLVGGLAALGLILAASPRRRSYMASLVTSKGWRFVIPGSFVGAYLALVLWLAGMKYTQVSISAVLNQTSNIFIFVFAALLLKEPINRQRTLGILLGVVGSILVTFC